MIKNVESKTTVRYLLSIPEIEKITGRNYVVKYDSFLGAHLEYVDGEYTVLKNIDKYKSEIIQKLLLKIKAGNQHDYFGSYFSFIGEEPVFVVETVTIDKTGSEEIKINKESSE